MANGEDARLKRRFAAAGAWSVASASAALLFLVACGMAIDTPGRVPGLGKELAFLAAHAAGLVRPLFAFLSAAIPTALLVAIVLPDRRTWRVGLVLVLAAGAWLAARGMGVRPPTSRTGVFYGMVVYGTVLHADVFVPCPDSAPPLPRGADLVRGGPEQLPVLASIRVPSSGWYGSHPSRWQRSWSDSHGGRYYIVHLRGTMSGPGHYGGLPPFAQYRFDVDSVVAIQTRRREDHCP